MSTQKMRVSDHLHMASKTGKVMVVDEPEPHDRGGALELMKLLLETMETSEKNNQSCPPLHLIAAAT